MDEQEILINLRLMADRLDGMNHAILNEDWNSFYPLMSQVKEIEERIRKNPLAIETLLTQNPLFAQAYQPLKETLLARTAAVSQTISSWRDHMGAKISNTKNVIDNISKYFSPSNSSYYIDCKE